MPERNQRSDGRAAQPGGPSTVRYHTVYHWDRILVALLALVALVVGVVFLGAALFSNDEADAVPKPAATEQVDATAMSDPASNPEEASVGGPMSDTAPLQPQPPQPPQELAAPAATDDTPASSEEQTTPSAAEPVAPAAEGPIESGETLARDDVETPVPTQVDEASEVEPVASPRLSGFSVTTPSPAIVRARFAASVRDNEPEGEAASIEPNENGMVRVYFFTEVKDRKGDQLMYRWSRDGKRVATVNAGAWNNAWRSYSSKFITPAQQGDWRVELVDAAGTVLAAGTFSYAQ